MSWPDFPSRRLEYASDGTIVKLCHSSGYNRTSNIQSPPGSNWQFDPAQTNQTNIGGVLISTYVGWLNNETAQQGSSTDPYPYGNFARQWFGLQFKEPMDLYGFYLATRYDLIPGPAQGWMAVSYTEGEDGLSSSGWEQWGPYGGQPAPTTGALYKRGDYTGQWRTDLGADHGAKLGVTFVKAHIYNGYDGDCGFSTAHFYGEPSVKGDRILFIDNDTGLEFDAPWEASGPRGETIVKEIRLKNNSTTSDASDITLIRYDLSGNLADNLTFNDSGAGSTTTLTVASIAAGALYPAADVIELELATTGSTILQLQAARVRLDVGMWRPEPT